MICTSSGVPRKNHVKAAPDADMIGFVDSRMSATIVPSAMPATMPMAVSSSVCQSPLRIDASNR